jgi:hypothetical protein
MVNKNVERVTWRDVAIAVMGITVGIIGVYLWGVILRWW